MSTLAREDVFNYIYKGWSDASDMTATHQTTAIPRLERHQPFHQYKQVLSLLVHIVSEIIKFYLEPKHQQNHNHHVGTINQRHPLCLWT